MGDKERYELRFVIDELFTALDNWRALRRQLERDAMETTSPFFAPRINEDAFNNADKRCERALYNVLSLAGWAPRIWRMEREQESRILAERMLSSLTNMDDLHALVRLADPTPELDTEVETE
jgi:hypothetical protein